MGAKYYTCVGIRTTGNEDIIIIPVDERLDIKGTCSSNLNKKFSLAKKRGECFDIWDVLVDMVVLINPEFVVSMTVFEREIETP